MRQKVYEKLIENNQRVMMEQKTRIDDLKSENASLTAKIAELKNRSSQKIDLQMMTGLAELKKSILICLARLDEICPDLPDEQTPSDDYYQELARLSFKDYTAAATDVMESLLLNGLIKEIGGVE